MNELDNVTLDKTSFSWRDIRGRDKWDTFTVTATLTVVGTPTYSGRVRFNGRKCEFQITLVASTSIASTAGTSYVDLPVAATGLTGMAVMSNDTTNIAVGVCHVDVAGSKCYLPAQTASGNTFNVTGWFEV